MANIFETRMVLLLFALFITYVESYFPPAQVHINYGSTPDIMVFNWLTWDNPIITSSIVRIGESSEPKLMNKIFSGESYNFIDGGSLHTHRTIHVVNASNLEASKIYYYQVGDYIYGWSPIYSFKTQSNSLTLKYNLPERIVIYGDMGNYNGQILPWVTEEGLNNEIDFIIHVGDFAYNMQDDNSTIGDYYNNDIQTLS